MSDDLILLFAGTILGFSSAFIIELIKSRIERDRLKQERVLETVDEREKGIREFLSPTADRKITPAWLTLVETSHPLPFFQRIRTEDAMELSEATSSSNAVLEKATLEKYLLAQTQIIGRQADCEIHLTDATVSRLHAMVRYEDGCFVIYDLASRSGSYVNGNKVTRNGMLLHPGDQLKIGDSILVFGGNMETENTAAEEKKKAATTTKPSGLGTGSKRKKAL
jgi:hypothetical protein